MIGNFSVIRIDQVRRLWLVHGLPTLSIKSVLQNSPVVIVSENVIKCVKDVKRLAQLIFLA